MIYLRLAALLLLSFSPGLALTQESNPYSFRQSISAFAEYSNDSSHIFLGVSQNRRLVGLGLTYSRRLLHTHYFEWNYSPELLPFVLIQDPVSTLTVTSSESTSTSSAPTSRACHPATFVFPSNPVSQIMVNQTCSTRWTYAGGLSPLGQRISFTPGRRLQLFVVGNAGFLVSPHDVPVNDSSNFNFTFEFGAGVEFFHDRHHSWSVEYRLHHLSNAYTGFLNPGVDNQIIKLTYTLGH